MWCVFFCKKPTDRYAIITKKIKINYLRFRSNKLHPIVSLGTLEKHILLQRDKASVISESKSDLFFELIDFEEEEVTKCPL